MDVHSGILDKATRCLFLAGWDMVVVVVVVRRVGGQDV